MVNSKTRRRPVNLSIREDVIADAKSLSVNASQAAEAGIAAAVRKAKEDAWLRENAAAVQVHNERIEREGVFYLPEWAKPD